jgi:predicted dehydrogenase
MAEEAQRAFDVEDFAAGQIRFTNGSSLTIEASWASNRPEAEFMETRLYGSDGGLVQRNLRETYEFEAEMYFERNGAQYDMRLHPPVPEAVNPNYYFADCILNDRPHMATGEEGLVVQELLDALYASAAEGAPVRVED